MVPCTEPPFEMKLPARSVLRVADADGVGIECREGCLWITLDGDPRDIVLEPGKRFQHGGHRPALVSALLPSNISISCARPATLPRPAPPATRWPWWRRHPVAAMAFTWGALAKAADRARAAPVARSVAQT